MPIWSLHAKYLDDSRLMRHHQTIHAALHAMLKKPSKTTENRYYRHAGYLVLRHWEAAGEMILRGFSHASPVTDLWKQIPSTRKTILFEHSQNEIVKDIKTLRMKQRKASSRREEAGRFPIVGIPNEVNELAALYSKGLPKDCFFL